MIEKIKEIFNEFKDRQNRISNEKGLKFFLGGLFISLIVSLQVKAFFVILFPDYLIIHIISTLASLGVYFILTYKHLYEVAFPEKKEEKFNPYFYLGDFK